MAGIAKEQISIPQFYAGRHIIITGASGFIGKVLIEKILRSCPDVAGLHLILRKKKGVSPIDRIKLITQIELFEVLRVQNPNFEEKLHVVSGDMSLPGLGISDEARQFLIKNVSVIFHVAATVRFDDPLTRAILINVRGTRDLALMAREMPNLAIFLHVSTIYCNADKKVVDEKLYPPHGDWRKMIAAAEKLDPLTLTLITSKLKGLLPNTYTFSKSLAEHCLHDVLQGKPFAIARPSNVISSFLEPVKGWIDNFNGPVGLLMAAAKGGAHISLTRLDLVTDFIPVDLVAKAFLIAAYKHGLQRYETNLLHFVKFVRSDLQECCFSWTPENPPPIYNCSAGDIMPVTAGRFRDLSRKVMDDLPLNNMLWELQGICTTNRTIFLIGTLILHVIPAMIFDTVLRLSGRKPRFLSMQRRIYAAQYGLAPFSLNTRLFRNDKAVNLDKNLLESDKDTFRIDYRDCDTLQYAHDVVRGVRRYLLKESDDTLPAARKHRFRMIIIKRVVYCLLVACILYVLKYQYMS